MERYEGVAGQKMVDAIAPAVEASDGKMPRAPSPTVAPFELDRGRFAEIAQLS